MTLTLKTSHPELDSALKSIDKDNITTPAELMAIRDSADQALTVVKNEPTLEAVKVFQKEMDEAVQSMQKVALAARKNKITPEERDALIAGVEAQVAYVVLGYKSSIERLNTFNQK